MRKIVLAGVLSLGLVGCASTTGTSTATTSSVKSSVQVVDFDTAIRAYEQDKNIVHLKSAEKYATTHSQKAILERKMVDYLGVDKVFKVKIKDKLSRLIKTSSAGLFTAHKQGSKKNTLTIDISLRPNLPFSIQYNHYKLGLSIVAQTEHNVRFIFGKKSIQKGTKKVYCNRNILLSKSNGWHYKTKKTLDEEITIHETGNTAMDGKYLLDLKSITYTPTLRSSSKEYTILEKANLYVYTNNNCSDEKFPKFAYRAYGNVGKGFMGNRIDEYCKKIGDGSWRVPLYYEVGDLRQKFGLSFWHYNSDPTNLNAVKRIACVKNITKTVKDLVNKLEWQDDSQLVHSWSNKGQVQRHSPKSASTICRKLNLNGKGWRLPTLSEYQSNTNLEFHAKMNKWSLRYSVVTSDGYWLDSIREKGNNRKYHKIRRAQERARYERYEGYYRCVRDLK